MPDDFSSSPSSDHPTQEELLRQQQEELLRRRAERGWQETHRVLVADEVRELRWSQER